MSPHIITERMTAKMEGEFCVFLIGMRINKPLKVHKWFPVARAMKKMLNELSEHKDLGFLDSNIWFGRTLISVQYWQSHTHLMEYATNKNHQHLPSWTAFVKNVGDSGDVGIWHETYSIKPGSYESIYQNMPPFGLGAVGNLMPATGHNRSAKDRIKA